MKIKIKQSKLLDILNYLSVDGMFPFSVITIKDNKIISSQAEKEGAGWRYAEFSDDYFEEIDGEGEGLRIDIEAIKKFASLRNSDTTITIQYPSPKNKTMMQIKGGRAIDKIAVTKLDKSELKYKIPFKIEENTPYLNKGKTPLSTSVVISKASLKQMNDYASAHNTEFFRLMIGKSKNLIIRIGDIKAVGNHSDYKPNAHTNSVDGTLDVTFTRGIKELSKTVHGDVEAHLRSGTAGWFSEEGISHKFGLLVSPVKGM